MMSERFMKYIAENMSEEKKRERILESMREKEECEDDSESV